MWVNKSQRLLQTNTIKPTTNINNSAVKPPNTSISNKTVSSQNSTNITNTPIGNKTAANTTSKNNTILPKPNTTSNISVPVNNQTGNTSKPNTTITTNPLQNSTKATNATITNSTITPQNSTTNNISNQTNPIITPEANNNNTQNSKTTNNNSQENSNSSQPTNSSTSSNQTEPTSNETNENSPETSIDNQTNENSEQPDDNSIQPDDTQNSTNDENKTQEIYNPTIDNETNNDTIIANIDDQGLNNTYQLNLTNYDDHSTALLSSEEVKSMPFNLVQSVVLPAIILVGLFILMALYFCIHGCGKNKNNQILIGDTQGQDNEDPKNTEDGRNSTRKLIKDGGEKCDGKFENKQQKIQNINETYKSANLQNESNQQQNAGQSIFEKSKTFQKIQQEEIGFEQNKGKTLLNRDKKISPKSENCMEATPNYSALISPTGDYQQTTGLQKHQKTTSTLSGMGLLDNRSEKIDNFMEPKLTQTRRKRTPCVLHKMELFHIEPIIKKKQENTLINETFANNMSQKEQVQDSLNKAQEITDQVDQTCISYVPKIVAEKKK